MLRAKAAGTEVLGLFYDLGTARVLVLDEDAQRFVPVHPDSTAAGTPLDRIAAGHGHGVAAAADRALKV